MYHILNLVESRKHLSGVNILEVTNRKLSKGKTKNLHTVHFNHHEPGDFTLGLDLEGYLYITNRGPASIDYRLGKLPKLDHIQRGRKVALMPDETITFFVSYINHIGASKSDQLKIQLMPDLSLLFELN